MAAQREADLYPHVKGYLEDLGFEVRGEVGKCDVVGHDGGTLVAVEMKLSLGLPVVYQALERLGAVDLVYVAVSVQDGRKARANWDRQVPDAVRLCRMLGVGLLSVRDGAVVVHCDPGPYAARKQPRRRAKLLGEFTRRSGDHNVGGTAKRPRVTAYREDALRCAQALAAGGAASPARLRDLLGMPKAAGILRGNVYGWFERVRKGVYDVTPAGADALALYSDVLEAQRAKAAAARPAPPAPPAPRPVPGAADAAAAA